MKQKVKIATLGSHSALQILKGAHDEGFSTIAVTTPSNTKVYKSFGVADEILEVGNFKEFPKLDDKLTESNAVVVPHGSFTAYLSLDDCKNMKSMYYGNKTVLDWEFDRMMQRRWIEEAGLKPPKIFCHASHIDRPTIVKYYGAKGGKGYFFARNEKEFETGISKFGKSPLIIQEYIIGVPFFIHYFYSNLTGELEIMSMDKRYESNVDSLGRIPLRSQQGMDIDPSFVVVGNQPIVLRESLLAKAFEMGERLVESSKKLMGPKGLYGPFCIETIITPESEFYVIEVSARIVAGTNCFIPDSPYTALKYDVPMTSGRRIALEIKRAIAQERLEEIVR